MSAFPLWVLPALAVAIPFATGVGSFLLGEGRPRLRTFLNIGGGLALLGVVLGLAHGAYAGADLVLRFQMAGDLDFVLRADGLALLFAGLSSALWLVTTVYAIGYLGQSPQRARFFGFFGLCVTAAVGVALAGNLITFFLFYELLTLSTYPLVVHNGTETALAGGRTYLLHTMAGGALFLIGLVWLHGLAGPLDFSTPGALLAYSAQHRGALIAIFALMVLGVGVKAALFPLHGWLPIAMVAPAPVSALLHAVAVVKAGAFGVTRVVHYVYGTELAASLGVLLPLAALAAFTILYGSLRALAQDDLKRRLAYSTISQVSYIILGVALGGATAAAGGLVHLVHQGLLKITLFFCAGLFAETLHIKTVSGMNGIGRRMPWTLLFFTIGALGMIGVPPIAGFISKWYLGWGALQGGQPWAVGVLLVSSLLNAAYFLPILYRGWFLELPPTPQSRRWEAHPWMLIPAGVTAALSVLVGIAAGSHWSPLALARYIAEGMFAP